MTKQHIFIIENNLQKVGQSFFYLSDVSFNWDRTIGQTLMLRPAV